MYYQHDWFMIQIQMMVQFIAKVVFNKDLYEIEAFYETESAEGGNDPLDKALASLLAQSRFQEAEALVRRNLSSGRLEGLRSALYFYNALNQMPDERLEAHGFSREQIRRALDELTQTYQITVPNWDELMP